MVTVVESLIASSGGDYATVDLWEAGTDDALTTLDEQHDGLLADEVFATGQITWSGATTDATRYRRLKPEGAPYSLIDDSGPVVQRTWSSGGNSGSILFLQENYARLEGICFRAIGDASNGGRPLYLDASDTSGPTICDGVTAVVDIPGNSLSYFSFCAFYANNTNARVKLRNCKVWFASAQAAGSSYGGFSCRGAESELSNCAVYGAPGPGFRTNNSAVVAKNCISVGCNVNGAVSEWVHTTSIVADYNMSGDASAPGTTKWTGEDAADIYEDADAGDLRPKSTGNAYGTGVDLSSSFTTDITGATRTLWSLGPYDEAASSSINLVFDAISPQDANAVASLELSGVDLDLSTVSAQQPVIPDIKIDLGAVSLLLDDISSKSAGIASYIQLGNADLKINTVSGNSPTVLLEISSSLLIVLDSVSAVQPTSDLQLSTGAVALNLQAVSSSSPLSAVSVVAGFILAIGPVAPTAPYAELSIATLSIPAYGYIATSACSLVRAAVCSNSSSSITVIEVYKNGAPTGLLISLASEQKQTVEFSEPLTINAGDVINLRVLSATSAIGPVVVTLEMTNQQ